MELCVLDCGLCVWGLGVRLRRWVPPDAVLAADGLGLEFALIRECFEVAGGCAGVAVYGVSDLVCREWESERISLREDTKDLGTFIL